MNFSVFTFLVVVSCSLFHPAKVSRYIMGNALQNTTPADPSGSVSSTNYKSTISLRPKPSQRLLGNQLALSNSGCPKQHRYSSTCASYQVSTTLTVHHNDFSINKLILILGIPRTNIYQQVSDIRINGINLENFGIHQFKQHSFDILSTIYNDPYIRYLSTNKPSKTGRSSSSSSSNSNSNCLTTTLSLSYNVTLYEIRVDVSNIKVIYDYDTKSRLFQLYTQQNDGVFIDCTNKQIQLIGNKLWQKSNGNILNYVKNVYEYIGSTFKYIKKEIRSTKNLNDIFLINGGECGDFSTIFVNLLRFKYIPSRHLFTRRPNGTYHVWNDFYLEKYGWIPVDCTNKMKRKNGDYFGKVGLQSNGIILNHAIDMFIEKENANFYQIQHLQTYFWWYYGTWTNDGRKQPCVDFKFVANKKQKAT